MIHHPERLALLIAFVPDCRRPAVVNAPRGFILTAETIVVTGPPVDPTDRRDRKLRPGVELPEGSFSELDGGVNASANDPPALVVDADAPEDDPDPEDPPAEPEDDPLDEELEGSDELAAFESVELVD